jgi:hypothetical protein
VGDDFVMQDFNDAAEAVAEGDARTWIGVRASARYADHPEILADLHACLTQHRVIRRELRFRYPVSGRERDLALSCVFVPPLTVMLHSDDITERQAREAMPRSENQHALGQLASGIARDLGQSLTRIASQSDLARQALAHAPAPADLTELQDLLTTTTQAVMDGGEIVKRLLLLTQAAAEAERHPADLSDILRDAA